MTQNEKTPKTGEVVSQAKNAKSDNGKSTPKEYVKMRDMQEKDITQLPKFPANVLKNKSKRGNIFYELSVRLNRLLTVRIPLNDIEFYLITKLRGLSEDKPIQTIDVWCRLVEGFTENGVNWKRYEVYVCKDVVFDKWFTDQEKTLMDVAKIELPFIKSEIKIDNSNDYELDDEEVAKKYKGIF